MKIHLGRCPHCATGLEAGAARPIAWCPRCPYALHLPDLTALVAHRPGDSASIRLPFYLFDEDGAPVWVAGFRCFQQAARADLDAALTEAGYFPDLAPAPLAALCARGPAQARRLARERGFAPGPAEPKLCSLAVRREGDLVIEPVTGWRVLARLLAPEPLDPARRA